MAEAQTLEPIVPDEKVKTGEILGSLDARLINLEAIAIDMENKEEALPHYPVFEIPARAGENNCSCVVYLQRKGLSIKGNAINVKPNYEGVPEVGDVLLLRYAHSGHVALIEEVLEDGVNISEDNYIRCKHTKRFVPFEDPHIVGYWREPTLAK